MRKFVRFEENTCEELSGGLFMTDRSVTTWVVHKLCGRCDEYVVRVV